MANLDDVIAEVAARTAAEDDAARAEAIAARFAHLQLPEGAGHVRTAAAPSWRRRGALLAAVALLGLTGLVWGTRHGPAEPVGSSEVLTAVEPHEPVPAHKVLATPAEVAPAAGSAAPSRATQAPVDPTEDEASVQTVPLPEARSSDAAPEEPPVPTGVAVEPASQPVPAQEPEETPAIADVVLTPPPAPEEPEVVEVLPPSVRPGADARWTLGSGRIELRAGFVAVSDGPLERVYVPATDLEIAPIGTVYTVQVEKGATIVAVQEGRVELRRGGRRVGVVGVGESTLVHQTGQVSLTGRAVDEVVAGLDDADALRSFILRTRMSGVRSGARSVVLGEEAP